MTTLHAVETTAAHCSASTTAQQSLRHTLVAMVLGVLAVGLGAAYLSAMPQASAKDLVAQASEEARGLAEFLVSRFMGRSNGASTSHSAKPMDAAAHSRSRLLLFIGGVGLVVLTQKIYRRFVKATPIKGATVVVTGASQVCLQHKHEGNRFQSCVLLTLRVAGNWRGGGERCGC